ncbi:MAG TPA: hypothetical protein VMX75_01645, partial [Spirochaetia bacterium]|nr:hypothetical protein [Spirochaetia bacterium]
MFFKSFTPLFSSSDTIRAARIYPGGQNLDRLFGEKSQKEEGWYYPEAWLFSPEPAINPGSRRGDEGQTLICDMQGREYSWKEYLARRGEEVLGKGRLNITVKLLDGSCTLPKEFHFRAEDEPKLRGLAGFAGFNKTLIKPEVWIRHPDPEIGAGRSFVGFREPMS